MTGRVQIGIAGWSYADWQDVVYPPGCRDRLRFCAGLLDCLEINTTFYRVPSASLSARWVERTDDLDVFFTAKLPQDFTHRGLLGDELVAQTRDGFAPLIASGRLRALLAQFSHRFSALPSSRRYLRDLVDSFRDAAPIVVEVRHRSWAADDAMGFLRDLGVSVCHLDYPGSGTGFGLRRTGAHGDAGIAYFRAHGRNDAAWFSKQSTRDEVYDHEYTAAEVAEIADRIDEIRAGAAETIVIANNHYHGKAVKLGLELLARIRERKVDVPDGMAQRYPDLVRIARGVQRGLFD